MQAVVDSASDPATKAAWQAALQTFRMPYWDWARNLDAGAPIMPPSLTSPTLAVVQPDGSTDPTFANPLYSYKFHASNGNLGLPILSVSTDLSILF